jgi:hypothetical protein
MHRSGTSATAGWLHQIGINMGDQLLDRNINNQKGHFEDLSLLNFHLNIAHNEKVHNWKNYSKIKLKDENSFKYQAQRLIAKRDEKHTQWGWKEPRMVMYLDYWKPLLNDAMFLIIYRHYSQVTASLVNREIRNLSEKMGLKLSKKMISFLGSIFRARRNKYIQLWSNYNKELLKFYKNNKSNSIILDFDSIRSHPLILFQFLKSKGFDITKKNDFFDSSLIQQNKFENLNLQAEELYIELNNSRTNNFSSTHKTI